MRAVKADGQGWTIGALNRLADVADAPLPAAYGALTQAAGSAATPGIRNLATLGGNLLQRPRCWYFRHAELPCLKKGGAACPAKDGENRLHAILGGGPCYIVHPSTLAVALVALDARAEVVGGEGARTVPVGDLFALPSESPRREHTLADTEILVRVVLPPPRPGQRSVYEVAKERQSFDWPLAEVAVSLVVDGGVIRSAVVSLGHVAPTPWRAGEVEEALVGAAPNAELFARVAPLATNHARPLSQNAYKVRLVQGLLRAALHRACEIPSPA
jgi:xanthine dehydrogenase YagS FAD-binding subunit